MTPPRIHFLSSGIEAVLGALNIGRQTKLGAMAVIANSKGYRITFRGKTVATGVDLPELLESLENFQAAVQADAEAES